MNKMTIKALSLYRGDLYSRKENLLQMKAEFFTYEKVNDIKLSCLDVGDGGTVTELRIGGALRRRLLDLGLLKGSTVVCVGKSPMGDPMAFLIRGAIIALRARDCDCITVRPKNGNSKEDEI